MLDVVLLRDFEDGVPKDFRVAFCHALPQDALCVLCENVSARLYRDPLGHGYCHSCREMCKREDMFDCATCGEKWHIAQVKREQSVHEAIWNARVICPKSRPDEPVKIPFIALKAHLKNCSCSVAERAPTAKMWSSDSVSQAFLSGKQQRAVFHGDPQDESTYSKHLSGKEQSSVRSGEPQGESKSSKVAVCSYCKEVIPKKSILKHVEDCRQELQNSLQYQETLPGPKLGENRKTTARRDSFGDRSADFPKEREMTSCEAEDDTTDAPTKFTDRHADYFSGVKRATGNQALPTDSSELAQQLNDALSKICDLEEEIAELKQTAAKTKDDTDLLNAAVPTIQGDMRNVQIQCEQRILKSEKTVSSLEESHTSLQETMSVLNEETKAHLYTVEEMVKNMTEKLSLDVHNLQQQNNWFHDAFNKLSAEVEKMKKDQREFVQNVFAAQDDTKKGKKGQFRH